THQIVLGPATATPDNSLVQTPKPAVISPSVTPIPFSKVTDLAPDLPAKDKTQVIVYRCNGTYELYYIGYVPVSEAVNLLPGDVIVNVISPASLMGHVAPLATYGAPSASGGPAAAPPATAEPVTGYPAPAQTESGYPGPGATPTPGGPPSPTSILDTI